MKKRIIYLFLLILWMGVIFYFSSQSREASTKQSDVINSSIIKTVKTFNKNVNESNLYDKLFKPVRKNAHFVEFFVLGLLSFLYINTFNINIKKKIRYCFLLCLLYSSLDELHQEFVSGRDGNMIDILIDILGSASSIFICYFLYKKHVKRTKKVYNK